MSYEKHRPEDRRIADSLLGRQTKESSRRLDQRQDHSQKQPRSQLLINDAGILADPAYPGIFRIDALHQRAGIHVRASLMASVACCQMGRGFRVASKSSNS